MFKFGNNINIWAEAHNPEPIDMGSGRYCL